jgi:hypothetical protein
MDKHITINMAPHMFAVLSGLTGLGVAVMQNDAEAAQGFAMMLSEKEVEPIAKELIDLLQSISRDAFDDGPQRPKIEIVS